MLDFVRDAGPLFYPLALCSLVASMITVERALVLKQYGMGGFQRWAAG